MNIDIRLRLDVFDHPKLKKLRRRLGSEGVESLIRLWLWTAASRCSGRLSGLDVEAVELAASWDGEEGALVRELCALRLLDEEDGTFVIHDWADHQIYASQSDERSRRARAAAKVRWHGEEQEERQIFLDGCGTDASSMREQCSSMRAASSSNAPRTKNRKPGTRNQEPVVREGEEGVSVGMAASGANPASDVSVGRGTSPENVGSAASAGYPTTPASCAGAASDVSVGRGGGPISSANPASPENVGNPAAAILTKSLSGEYSALCATPASPASPTPPANPAPHPGKSAPSTSAEPAALPLVPAEIVEPEQRPAVPVVRGRVSRRGFVPPEESAVHDYCQRNGFSLDAGYFVDYYASRGWMLGKGQPMRDWQAVVRLWVRRDRERAAREASARALTMPRMGANAGLMSAPTAGPPGFADRAFPCLPARYGASSGVASLPGMARGSGASGAAFPTGTASAVGSPSRAMMGGMASFRAGSVYQAQLQERDLMARMLLAESDGRKMKNARTE